MPPKISLANPLVDTTTKSIDPAEVARSVATAKPPVSVWNRYDMAKEREDADVADMMSQAHQAVGAEEPALEPMPDPFTLIDPMDLAPGNNLQTPEQAQFLRDHFKKAQAARDAESKALGQDTSTHSKSGRPWMKIGKFDLGGVSTPMVSAIGGTTLESMGADLGESTGEATGEQIVLGAGLDVVSATLSGLGIIENMITGQDSALAELARTVPKIPQSASGVTNTVRGFLQYYMLFAPALGVTKMALAKGTGALGPAFAKAAPVTESVVSGGIADGVATWFGLEGDDDTIAEVVEKYVPEIKGSKFYSDFMQYITTQPGDSEAKKRWKNVLEGQIMGGVIGYSLKPKQAMREFGAMADGVQQSVYLRRVLNNEVGSVGGGMRPENAMPLIRGEMDDALREGIDLARAMEVATEARKAHLEVRIAANKERVEALKAGQDRAQQKMLINQAEKTVGQTADRAARLQEKLVKGESKVEEIKAGIVGAPDKKTKNRLSREKLAVRRTAAELDFVKKELAEHEGALASAKAKPELQLAPETVTPAEAKKFLPDTKLVDEAGQPKAVFHGTSASFEQFTKEKMASGAGGGLYGSKGIYLTESPEIAGDYALLKAGEAGAQPNIRKAYVDIRNPMDMGQPLDEGAVSKIQDAGYAHLVDEDSTGETFFRDLVEEFQQDKTPGADRMAAQEEARKIVEEMGYDGITHKGGVITQGKEHQVWIAFDPAQVKGAFSKEVPIPNPQRVPSIFGDTRKEGVKTIDPLSRNNSPMGDGVAEWLRSNRDMAETMEKPIRDQFGERLEVFRQQGAGSNEKLTKMMQDYAIPIEKLDEFRPGGGAFQEEQAALTSLVVDMYGRTKSLSAALKNAPHDRDLMAAWEQSLNDLNKAYSTYMGIGSQAGRMERSKQFFDNILTEAGLDHGINAIRNHGGGISAGDKVALAALISAQPAKHQGRFMNAIGKMLGKGNPWVEALVEGFVATRFSTKTISRNIIGTSVMQASGVAARIAGGAAAGMHLPGTAGSNVTMTEGIKMAHGMLNTIGDALRLYRDMHYGFDGKLDFTEVASKMETTRTPAITSQALGIENPVGASLVNGLGYMTRTATRQMVAWDQVFQMIARQGQRQALAWRESVKKVRAISQGKSLTKAQAKAAIEVEYDKMLADFPAHLEKDVKAYGEYTTFADSFQRGDQNRGTLESIGDVMTSFTSAHPLVKILFPFVRTSIRIGMATTKYGLPGLGAMLRDTEDIITRSAADRAAINYGKQAVGAAAAVTAMTLAYNRRIIGEMPGNEDPKARELWKRNGWQPMSIVTEFDEAGRPLKSISLRGMIEPIGGIMRASTDAMYIIQGMYAKSEAGVLEDRFMEEAGEYVSAFLGTMEKITEDQLFFSQFTGLMDAVGRGDEKAMHRWIAGFTPASVREFSELIHPLTRELETFGDHLKAQLPGFRSGVAVKYNFLGEPYVKAFGVFDEEAPPGFVTNIVRDIVPVMATGDFDTKWRPVWDFIQENADMRVGIAHDRNLAGVRMDSEQQAAYARIKGGGQYTLKDGRVLEPVRDPGTGETLREALLDIVTDPSYGEDADGLALRRSVFKATVDGFTAGAQATMWDTWPKLMTDSIYQRVERSQLGG